MTVPTVLARIGGTGHASGPNWMDVSSRFRGATVNRGRSTELDKVMAGRATFKFSNADRAFDQYYSSGPFYPGLKLERLIQLQATWNGVSYPVFTGYIDSIRQTYSGPRESVAEIQATDAFKILAGVGLPSSIYAIEVANDTPRAWYRMGETPGSTTASDLGPSNLTGTVVGASPFQAPSLVTLDSNTAAAFTAPGATNRIQLPGSVWPANGSWSLEFWIKGSASGPNILFDHENGTGPFNLQVETLGAGYGQLGAFINSNNTAQSNVYTTVNVMDGAPHHIVIVGVPGTVLKIYLDGVNNGVVNSGSGNVPGAPDQTTYDVNGNAGSYTPGGYVIDEIAFYNQALSPARIAAHNSAGRTPWSGDLSGVRIKRILTYIGSDSSEWIIDNGTVSLSDAYSQMSALAYIQKVEETEQGLFFMQRDGLFRFRQRGWTTSTAATFGDGGGSELPYASLAFEEREDLLFNVVRRTREGGVTQEARDPASIADYYEHTDEASGFWVLTDAEMAALAQYRLARYKDPIPRIDALVVDPQANPTSLFPVLLGAELGDQFEVKRRPQGVGAAVDNVLHLEGTTVTVEPNRWMFTWRLSPTL